jgi:ABC-type protease/lipase transport system fused ATPase/permease subunit
MDVWSIIQMVVGGGFVAGVVEFGTWLRNRKADKVKAEAEAAQASATAKTSDIEAQRQEIDLMKYMRETMAEWMAQTEEGNKKNFANQDKMMGQLSRMDERLEKIELRVGDIETYLNGEYHTWLANKHTNRYGKN